VCRVRVELRVSFDLRVGFLLGLGLRVRVESWSSDLRVVVGVEVVVGLGVGV
jgi:hypothetical protein